MLGLKCKNNTKINKYLYKTNSRILCRHSYALSRAGAYKVLHNTLPLTTNGGDVEISNLITSNKLNAYYTIDNLIFIIIIYNQIEKQLILVKLKIYIILYIIIYIQIKYNLKYKLKLKKYNIIYIIWVMLNLTLLIIK